MSGLYSGLDILVIACHVLISNKNLILCEISFLQLFLAEVEDSLIMTSRVHLFVDRKSIYQAKRG